VRKQLHVGRLGGVAQVLGPLVGGCYSRVRLAQHFPVNVRSVSWHMADTQDDRRTGRSGKQRLDWPGQLSAACAMILLICHTDRGARIRLEHSWISGAIALRGAVGPVVRYHRSQVEDADASSFLVFESVFSWVLLRCPVRFAAFFGIVVLMNLYFCRAPGTTPLQTGMGDAAAALLATTETVSARLAHKIHQWA